MSDFSPETRASAIWATDAGQIAAGKAGDVFMLKTGQKEPDDLSEVEAVQMGTLLQEPIMRCAAGRWGLEFKDADYALGTPNTTGWPRTLTTYRQTVRPCTRSKT
jgi:hypothetical protein